MRVEFEYQKERVARVVFDDEDYQYRCQVANLLGKMSAYSNSVAIDDTGESISIILDPSCVEGSVEAAILKTPARDPAEPLLILPNSSYL